MLSLVTAAILYIPWDRYPQLAGSGVMIDFAAQSAGDDRLPDSAKNLGDKAVNPRLLCTVFSCNFGGFNLN